MWDFLASDWQALLFALIALACPLLHFSGLGHGPGRVKSMDKSQNDG